MNKTTAEKITLLNQLTLQSLGEHDKLKLVKNFTEASIQIMAADFGFAWWQPAADAEYQLVYKSDNIPYDPNPPRDRGGNYQASVTGSPVFVEDTSKEDYEEEYDVRPYMKSYVIIPIVYEEQFYGNVVLCYANKNNFDEDDHSLAEALGNAMAQSLTISRLYHKLNTMAYYDQLTGLPNRSLLSERLVEAHAKAEEDKSMFALFFVDLDRFKIINDIYGHHMGDLLLKQVAERMQKVVPAKATLARMGGDEFLVLLPNIDTVDEANRCAVEMQNIFTEYFELNEHEIYCNGSVGFAIYPLDGVDRHTLLKHADLALHRAKEHGGGNIQQYRMGQPLFYTMQPKLQSQLRRAIKNNELVLHYQPILNLKTKKIIGSEALIRWNHPEMGLLMPGEFIGQAEESGLIVQIGEWVIEEVCRQINEWESAGIPAAPVSINISPRELLRPSLVSGIEECLKKYNVPPSQIKVELTETFLMKNIDLSISILDQLRALGLRILIDDFGTGYASLNYLKRLPINAVKIDKTFTQGVPNSLQDAALTSAIIAISHQLGLEVVGEGVENSDQYEFLRAAQCNYGQGYFFHKPLSAEEFAKLFSHK